MNTKGLFYMLFNTILKILIHHPLPPLLLQQLMQLPMCLLCLPSLLLIHYNLCCCSIPAGVAPLYQPLLSPLCSNNLYADRPAGSGHG